MNAYFLSISYFYAFILFLLVVPVYSLTDPVSDTIVKRVEQHITFLRKLDKRYAQVTSDMIEFSKSDMLNDTVIHFDHDLITWAIKKIKRDQNLKPLFDIWSDFKVYRDNSPEDQNFLKECTLLIFIFYNNIFIAYDEANDRAKVQDVVELFQKINNLPIGELLDILDTISEQLVEMLEKYEPEANQSLFSWLRSNWWVPPTIVAAFITAVILQK